MKLEVEKNGTETATLGDIVTVKGFGAYLIHEHRNEVKLLNLNGSSIFDSYEDLKELNEDLSSYAKAGKVTIYSSDKYTLKAVKKDN